MSDTPDNPPPATERLIANPAVAQVFLRAQSGASQQVLAVSDGCDPPTVPETIAQWLAAPLASADASLAWTLDAQRRRWLVHRAHNPASEPVAHALVMNDAPVNLAQAIDTWGSHFWRTAIDASQPLATISPPLPGGRFARSDIAEFVAEPRHAQLVRFAIDALLTTPADQSIVLRASPLNAATTLAALTWALPRALLRDVSFCTCWPGQLAPAMRIMGVPPDDAADLPEVAFAAPFLGFNPATGRAAKVTATRYAQDAVAAIKDPNGDGWTRFLMRCDTLGAEDADTVLLLHAAAQHPEQLSARQIWQGCANATLGAWLARQPAIAQRLPDAILADPEAAGVIESLLAVAEKTPADQADPTIELFQRPAIERGVAAVRAGDIAGVETLHVSILPRLGSLAVERFAAAVLAMIAPQTLAWTMRGTLLPILAKATSPRPGDVSGKLAPWLAVDAAELAPLLALCGVSDAHKAAACFEVARRDTAITADAARTLAQQPGAVFQLMNALGDDEAGQTAAAGVFHAALDARGGKPLLNGLLAPENGFSLALLSRCLCPLLETGRLKARDMALNYGQILPRRLAGSAALDTFYVKLMADPGIARLPRRARKTIVGLIRQGASATDHALAAAVRQRALAWLLLRDFERRGSLAYESLVHLADQAAACHDEDLNGRVCQQAVSRMARLMPRSGRYRRPDRARTTIEGALIALARIPGAHPALVFRDLMIRWSHRRDFWRRPALVLAMVEIACGQGPLFSALPMLRVELKPARQELGERLARHPKLFDLVDQRATVWQEEPLRLWRSLKQAYPTRWTHRFIAKAANAAKLALLSLLMVGVFYLLRWIL